MTKEEQIYTAAIDEGLSPAMANLMVAQSKHESGANYTNNASKLYNNAFGYKYVGQTIYDQAGNNVVSKGNTSSEGNAYAAYTSFYWSAVEVARWIKRHIKNYNSITTPEQYAQALKSNGYYGDTVATYTAGLKRYFTNIIQKTSDFVRAYPKLALAGVGLIAVGVSVCVYFVTKNKK